MLDSRQVDKINAQGRKKISAKVSDSISPPQIQNMAWVLTDGSIGMENQSLAVAEAVGLPITIKRVTTLKPWKWLPRQLRFGALKRIDPNGDQLQPPWPRLLVTTGRHSIPLSIAIRELSGSATFTVHIQNPKTPFSKFDLVTAPIHDAISGPNVVITMGAPHRVTPEKLAAPFDAPLLKQHPDLPRPLIAVLLGGTSKAFKFSNEKALDLGRKLHQISKASGGTLLVTPSRRTPDQVVDILKTELVGRSHIIWDGTGDNPYFAFLGAADYLIVTGDSVNMVTEAAGTGKPVYVFHLEGHSSRFDEFHKQMERHGATRELSDVLESWSYEPVNDTEKIAEKIRSSLGLPAQQSTA